MRTAEDPEHNDEPDSCSGGVRTLQVPGDLLIDYGDYGGYGGKKEEFYNF